MTETIASSDANVQALFVAENIFFQLNMFMQEYKKYLLLIFLNQLNYSLNNYFAKNLMDQNAK